MNQYTFRGKVLKEARTRYGKETLKPGDWVQGDLIHTEKDFRKTVQIITRAFDQVEVDPATVCLCSGVQDAKERPVFEGDIIRICYGPFRKNNGTRAFKEIYRTAVGRDGAFCIKAPSTDPCGLEETSLLWLQELSEKSKVEIVGNVFDTPEKLSEA